MGLGGGGGFYVKPAAARQPIGDVNESVLGQARINYKIPRYASDHTVGAQTTLTSKITGVKYSERLCVGLQNHGLNSNPLSDIKPPSRYGRTRSFSYSSPPVRRGQVIRDFGCSVCVGNCVKSNGADQ